MPVKKTTKRSTRAKPSPEVAHVHREPRKDRQIGMSFILFLLFISLAIISFALYRVYHEQSRLLGVINSLSNEVSEKQVVVIPEKSDESNIKYTDSEVKDLKLGYKPCPVTFTGPCDDLMIYHLNADSSKEVLVPSVRALAGAPLTSELLQPLAVNDTFSRIAFGAWSYGGTRNANDKRVWVADISSGKILFQPTIVPSNAVYSPDMSYAAYYTDGDNGEEKVMIINLADDEEGLAAKAQNGVTYKDANSKVAINWLENNKFAIVQYQLSDAGSEPTIIGEREITIN